MASIEPSVQRLPGFNADVSLDESEKRYYAVGEIKNTTSIIVPAGTCCSAVRHVCDKCEACCQPVLDPGITFQFGPHTPSYCSLLFGKRFTPPYCVPICEFCYSHRFNCTPTC